MVNKLTRKAILSIKKNIDMYGEEMAKLQEKIAAIDEKYRKMAEEARKDLAIAYANLESEQEIWNTSLSRYDAEDVNEVLGDADTTAEQEENSEPVSDSTEAEKSAVVSSSTSDEEPEAEGKVVDNLFPENNEPEPTKEAVPVEAEQPLTPEEAVPAKSAEEKALDEIWPEAQEETASPTIDDMPPADLEQSDNDNWPEFPQEW